MDGGAIAATIGFSMVGVLQIANLWQGRVINSKLDDKVSASQCLERRDTDKSERIHCKREMRIIENKIWNHCHNGNGVKITADVQGINTG